VPGTIMTETQLDQMWRVLVANRGPNGSNPPNWYRRACKACFDWYATQQDSYFNMKKLRALRGTPPSKLEFLDRMQQVIRDRKCFRAAPDSGNNEYVSLAPPKAELGDLLCIIFGSSVPVVLRRNGRSFNFVGECYVHGMMNGEAVETLSRRKIRTFVLR
jgi:hypothetical protein